MYKANILMYLEIKEYKDNEPTGKILKKEDLNPHNIKSKQLLTISGDTQEECLQKVKDFLNV